MAERISGAALTLAFNKRANSELGVLHEKLEVQLREDISKDIYTKSVITEKENDLVAYLSKLNKVCRHSIDVCTPESDVYLTPETSPTDIKHRYGHTRCASDSGINNLSDSSANLRKTNALYYSLVTVDEVFDSYTNETEAVLERELAEQDELFKSFKSIISKEVKNGNRSKGNKPSKFTLPFNPKQRQKLPRVQTKSLNKATCLDFKFDLDTTIKERYSQKYFVVTKIEKQNINNLNEQIKSYKTLKPVELSNVVENDLKVSDSHFNINYDKKCLQEDVQAKQIEAMNKQKLEVDEVMSNPEIEVQGQDSCLEAGSSGYLTGSSPKDQTVSETSNADVTEVATSDDIPHDNDPSAQSSSVSSDGGTWDSTFPNSTTIEDSVTNQDSALHVCSRSDIKTDKLHSFENTKALNNTVAISVHSVKKNCIDTDKNLETHYTNSKHTAEQGAFSHRQVDLPQRDKNYFTTQCLKTNNHKDKGVNFLEKNLSYNIQTHPSEWNSRENIGSPEVNETVYPELNKSFSDQENCDLEIFVRHSEDHFELLDKNDIESNSAICKTNCFIDASSLSDESEVPVPIPRISHRDNVYYDLLEGVANSSPDTESMSKQDKLNLVCNESEFGTSRKRDNESFPSDHNSPVYNGISKCDVDSSDVNFISRESSLNLTYSGTIIDQNNTIDDKSKQISTDFENRRASLIRRNTFELEPDDEKLAMLRQEYEKRQGNLIFKSCSQSSNNSDSNSEIDVNMSLTEINSKEDFHVSKQEPPDTLLLQKNPHIRPLADDEAQSPDSLNNDGPADNLFQEKIQKQVKSTDGISLEDFDAFEYKYVTENLVVQSIDENNHSKINSSDFEDIKHTFENQSSDIPSMLSNKTNSYSLNENPSLENKIETMPIVSGGASLSDFSMNKEISASPLMNRRKTEFTPIVSGGSVALPTPEPEPKPKPSSSLTTSWVVDMSDTVKSPPEARKKKRSNSILSTASSDHCEFEDNTNKSTSRMNNSAMGFFIPLDDPFDEKSSSESGYKSMTPQMTRSLKSKDIASNSSNETMVASNVSNSSCGFYIDLKGEQESNKQASTSSLTDNKLFTMFIDLGETGSVKSSENISPKTKMGSPHLLSKKNRPAKTHTERFTSKHFTEVLPSESHQSLESNSDISEHPEVSKGKLLFTSSTPPPSRQISHTDDSTSDLTDSGSKKSFYMFIEADASPVPRRRTLPSGLRPNIQRHSWNPDSLNAATTDSTQTEMPKKNHRRAHSVSVDKSLEIMFNVSQAEKKMSSTSSIIKNSNSNSIGYESGPSSIDEHIPRSLDKNNKLMMASWHGSIKPSTELQKVIARSERKDSKDSKSILGMFRTNENKSFDSCSEDKADFMDRFEETGSVSMKSDETFDLSNVSEVSSYRDIHSSTFVLDVSNVANATSNDMDLSTPSHDVVSELSKDDSDPTETDFVQAFNRERKLDSRTVTIDSKHNMRDRDTPITPDHSVSQPLISVPEESKSSFVKLSDMDKEPARIVLEEKRIVNRMSRSIPEASWIESKMMTRSATSRSLSRLFPHLHTVTRNRTPDSAEQDTDVSEMSSLQSSMEPSALEGSTEETDASSCTSGPCSRLGEDLLRMFLDEISPDVTVEVGGRRIKAHKCILSSRCQYFAAILSGGWVESAGNVISLQGFSYNAVHFALCHIYSGTSNIPDSINIVELATLADMLCLEGLKEIIMYTLKVKYCHFFHKPCPMCTVGVLECLPLAAAYGLDEIYRKSLRWITKYFVRVWPTKGFATLPRELLEKCYKQHIVHMSVDNVLETILCCGKLQSTIPAVRWAEPVITLTTRLHDSAVKYIAQHFCGILSNEMFLALGKEDLWNVSRLEEALTTAAEKLPPDQACKCHSRLYNILMVIDRPDPPPEMQWSQTFVQLLRRLSAVAENSLIKQAARAARTPAWSLMEPHLRHKIQDAACLVIVPGDERRRARHSSLLRRNESSTRTGDLHQVKVAITQQAVTTTRKPMSSATNTTTTARATSAKSKTQPVSSAATKTEESGPRPKTWPYKMAEVKSRYLEQRIVKTQPTVRDKPSGSVPVTRRTVTKSIISSSDSSRTSSPAMKPLNTRPSRSLSNKESNLRPKCDDGISMSTDSLAESTMSKPSINGNKTLIKKKTDTELNRAQVRIPLMDKTRRCLPNRIDGIKNKSTESLTKTRSQGNGFQPTLNKDSNKSKSSPIPLSKKSSTQSSPGVRDSPVIGRVKTTVASSPSPSLKRNTFSPKNPPEVKSSLLKRTSTYRVQTKSSANQTKSTPVKTSVTSNIKNCNNNRVQNKLSTQPAKLSTNNNLPQQISDTNKTEITPKAMVGSRSGTFLKDEPTILKKPQVTNVIE